MRLLGFARHERLVNDSKSRKISKPSLGWAPSHVLRLSDTQTQPDAFELAGATGPGGKSRSVTGHARARGRRSADGADLGAL
jgi:hypothetical protein